METQISRLRSGVAIFNFRRTLWPESSHKYLRRSVAEVLRLRAIKSVVCHRSAGRFAPTARRGRQDDGFVWVEGCWPLLLFQLAKTRSLHAKENSGKGLRPISSTHVVRRIYRRKHGAPVQGLREAK